MSFGHGEKHFQIPLNNDYLSSTSMTYSFFDVLLSSEVSKNLPVAVHTWPVRKI